MNEYRLILALLFGAIGLGFFVYGRRQKAIVPLICGVALMILPYFIPGTWPLVLAGVVLIVVPYYYRF